MSEKIVQLNEEVIKGQLKELVRGSVEETGDLIARKTINLSYDNQKFTDQVRKLHLRRKS